MADIRYRVLRKQRWFSLFLGAPLILCGVPLAVIQPAMVGTLVAGLILSSYYFVFARFGVDLGDSALTLHGLRRRRIGWPEITDIQVRWVLGSRQLRVYVRGGRPRWLRAPLDGPLQPDGEFDAKVTVIREHWLQHAGGPTAAP